MFWGFDSRLVALTKLKKFILVTKYMLINFQVIARFLTPFPANLR